MPAEHHEVLLNLVSVALQGESGERIDAPDDGTRFVDQEVLSCGAEGSEAAHTCL
jgi:hypothetical protein